MQSAAHYEVPVSEMIFLENTDVITSSSFNNNGNGNTDHGNTKPGKPGQGGHKD